MQPGYTFSFDPEKGYAGLVTGRPVVPIYARAGEYAAAAERIQQAVTKAKELAKSFWPNPGTGGWTNRLFSAHADWRHPGTGLRRPVPGGGTAVVITGGLNYLDWGNDKGVWKTSLPDAALDASAACGPLRRAGA